MQWALTLEGQNANEAMYMQVPDGTTPPAIGDSFHSTGELFGYFTVLDRQFMAEIKPRHEVSSFGWAFVLKKKPL